MHFANSRCLHELYKSGSPVFGAPLTDGTSRPRPSVNNFTTKFSLRASKTSISQETPTGTDTRHFDPVPLVTLQTKEQTKSQFEIHRCAPSRQRGDICSRPRADRKSGTGHPSCHSQNQCPTAAAPLLEEGG